MWCGGKVFIALWSEWSCKQSMKSHQFTSMISFTGSTYPTLIISLSCLHTPSFLPPLSLLSLHLSNLIFHSSLPPNLIPPFSFQLPCPMRSLFYCTCTMSIVQTPLISFFPSLSPLWFISLFLCLLSGVWRSFSVFLLLGVAHRNPPGSLRITAYYWLGLPDRKVDDEWQRGTANANGDL